MNTSKNVKKEKSYQPFPIYINKGKMQVIRDAAWNTRMSISGFITNAAYERAKEIEKIINEEGENDGKKE